MVCSIYPFIGLPSYLIFCSSKTSFLSRMWFLYLIDFTALISFVSVFPPKDLLLHRGRASNSVYQKLWWFYLSQTYFQVNGSLKRMLMRLQISAISTWMFCVQVWSVSLIWSTSSYDKLPEESISLKVSWRVSWKRWVPKWATKLGYLFGYSIKANLSRLLTMLLRLSVINPINNQNCQNSLDFRVKKIVKKWIKT